MLTRGRDNNWTFHLDGWCMKERIKNDAYRQEMQYHCLLFCSPNNVHQVLKQSH
jgi:hypothetical protein